VSSLPPIKGKRKQSEIKVSEENEEKDKKTSKDEIEKQSQKKGDETSKIEDKDKPEKKGGESEEEKEPDPYLGMNYAEIKAYREKMRELGDDKDKDDDEKNCFTDFVKILKYIFFVDTGRVLRNSNASTRELEAYDIQRLPPQFKNEFVCKTFRKLYKEWEWEHDPKNDKRKKKPTPMWRVYLRMEKKYIIISTVLRIIADIILILIPLMMIQYEGGFIYQEVGNVIVSQDVTMKAGVALGWACAIILAYFLQYMCRQHSEKFIVMSKFRIEQALKDQLFKKLLTANYISLGQSDPNQVSKILFFGIDNIMAMLTAIPAVVSAPIAIMLGCFLVARAHSNFFFLGAIIVYLLICFFAIDHFNGVSARYQAKYDSAQSLNSIKVEEFFDNITTIQTNSLGRCLKVRFNAIRKMANDTLKYLHLATGIAEVLLTLSPFLFTALAMSLFTFAKIGSESEDDSTRLIVCALAPMTIPIKVITDTLYKRRLFVSSFALVVEFLDSLRSKDGAEAELEQNIAPSKASSKLKDKATIIRLQKCSFLRDHNNAETFETIVNPKKNAFTEKQERYVIFKDPLNKVSVNFQIKNEEEPRRRQEMLVEKFTTGGTGSTNVNYCLKNIDLKITNKSKICVVGDENAGVNDFFLAIMKELILVEPGQMTVKGKACYLDMNNPKFIRDTIKENILLGRDFKKDDYLNYCDLVQLRLKKYPLKDRTVVVEGQKNIAENDIARILLARLLYSDADVVMMNNYFDKLPKERQVDTFNKIVLNHLKEKGKTVIYSTKIVHLMRQADTVVVMKDGAIVENDPYQVLMNNRASQLYKYLMTDPAGNTNLFRKVLDLYKTDIRKLESKAQIHPEDPIPAPDSPARETDLGLMSGREGKTSSINAPINVPLPGDKRSAVGGALAKVAGASGDGSKQGLSEREKRKNRRKVASTGEETNVGGSLAKLQKNIMYNGSLSTKVVFIGQSSVKFYIFFFSLLVTNISMGFNIIETCIWGRKVSFLDTYTEYLVAYDLLVIFYLAIVIIRDGIFTQMVIKNLNHLYNLMTNSLIDTQKEYLLQNPSNRIVYIMTKTISKIDRDLIRSYYKFFDSSFNLLVILGALNYFLYIFMSIVSVFVIIIIIPSYSYFNVACIKLSNFTTNQSSDLVEIFLSSFNFILPLRNHNISGYFSKKFTEYADTVMRAKIRLEDDILRWFHLRFMIYSTFLIVCILLVPIIVIQFLSGSFLASEWQFRFVSASVPLLVPVLLNFANSMTETSENMICVKSIVKYVLELSKNSEDASIIQELAAMPANSKKNKYEDREDIQETNLTNYILKNHAGVKELQLVNAPPTHTPSHNRLAIGPRSGLANTELTRVNTQVPGENKKRTSPNEPTKPLLMLQNVHYESKIGEQILKGINLKLYEAERVGIICEIGSGKDFLVNLLMTLMQKSEVPELGPSVYEIRGNPVDLTTAAELRKNMTYLYPNPSLLMGTVRDNIDPFKKYSDEDIMTTLHFLKIIKALQEYSGLFVCSDIEVFLLSKQNSIIMHEINLEQLKERQKGTGKDDRKSKKNLNARPSTKPIKTGSAISPGTPSGLIGREKMLQEMKEKTEETPGGKKNRSADQAQDPENRLDSKPINEDGEEEEIEEEENDDAKAEEERRKLNAVSSMTKLDKLFEQAIVDKATKKVLYKKSLKEIKRIFLGSDYQIESKEDEQVREFFETQFINEFPIPMPIPERAKRLDDDLEDFDMSYENHHIHFEDELSLMKAFLQMEVGQNGKNLNEDCRKIIMLAKVFLDKPPIIVYDEDALYIHGVHRSFYIKQLFQNLRESGILGFIKDFSQIYNYSNVLILEKGEIIEQDPPLDLINNQQSHLYRIVMKDDIRTLRKLENKLEDRVRFFERKKKKELMSIGKPKLKTGNKESSALHTGENSVENMETIGGAHDISNLHSPRIDSASNTNTLKGSKSYHLLRQHNQKSKQPTLMLMSKGSREGFLGDDDDDDDDEGDDEEHISFVRNELSK
jgi:ABC-type multidrug transport system fused ATPase/permease subunit